MLEPVYEFQRGKGWIPKPMRGILQPCGNILVEGKDLVDGDVIVSYRYSGDQLWGGWNYDIILVIEHHTGNRVGRTVGMLNQYEWLIKP
jgi:hypothetical protein